MVIAAASPPAAAASSRLYPPYKEMIVKAIGDLNEKDGSSKKAISKFIVANFSDLPRGHDAKLGTHLRRLKKKGVIVPVKKSFMLAGGGAGGGVVDLTVSVSGKRRAGRPPKMALLADAAAAASPMKDPGSVRIGDVVPRKLGRPRKLAKGGGLGNGNPLMLIFPGRFKLRPASILAALNPLIKGQSSEGDSIMVVDGNEFLDGRRKRGRPKKGDLVSGAVVGLEGKRRGRPRKVGPAGLSLMKGVAVGKRLKIAPQKFVHGVNQGSGGVGSVEKWSKSGRRIKVVYPGLSLALARRKKRGVSDKVVHPDVTPGSGGDELSAGKRKRGRPAKIVQEGLYLMNGSVGESVGKKKAGRPKKFVQSNLVIGAEESASGKKRGRPRKVLVTDPNITNGAVEGSVDEAMLCESPTVVQPALNLVNGCEEPSSGKRKPGRPKKFVLADPNIRNADVEASPDMRILKHQELGHSQIDLVTGTVEASLQQSSQKRKLGRPKKEALSSINKGKIGRPRKYSNLTNGDGANGNVVVNPGPSSPNSLQQSVEKRKPGRPKKVFEVSDNATLSSVMQPSSEEVVCEAMPGHDPIPAAVNVLVGMRIPDVSGNILAASYAPVEDNNVLLLNPVRESPGKTGEGLNMGGDPTPAALTTSTEKRKPGRPKKLSPQYTTQLGDDRIVMPNPVISSSRKIVGEVEIVMPTIKSSGRAPKRSKLHGTISNGEKMIIKEEMVQLVHKEAAGARI